MNGPNPLLTRAYGNEDIYREKLAGGVPSVGALFMGVLNHGLAKDHSAEVKELRHQAEILTQMARQLEHEQMGQARENLEFTQMPYSSMTRLASIAADAGEDLAKQAGIGDFAEGLSKMISGAAGAAGKAAPAAGGFLRRAGLTDSVGKLKWKMPLAVAGATALAYKGVKGGANYMNQEAQPANWGNGARLSNAVNQYGTPQLGTPL